MIAEKKVLESQFLKSLFEKCYTGESWEMSASFPNDTTFILYDNEKVIGFCMIHDKAPYPFANQTPPFLYNLCVDPEFRNKGYATELIKHVLSKHPVLALHGLPDSTLFKRLGAKEIGVWRNLYKEYIFGTEVEETQAEILETNHYDPVENLHYLN